MLVLHCIPSFEKRCSCQKLWDRATRFFYFVLFYISFYISRYHFLWYFRILFKVFLRKDFRHKFSLFNGFTITPYPLDVEESKSARHFERFLLKLPKYNRSYLVDLPNLIHYVSLLSIIFFIKFWIIVIVFWLITLYYKVHVCLYTNS